MHNHKISLNFTHLSSEQKFSEISSSKICQNAKCIGDLYDNFQTSQIDFRSLKQFEFSCLKKKEINRDL